MLKKIKLWYKLHKWISIVTGLVIVMWLITGFMITTPVFFPKSLRIDQNRPDSPDFRTVTMTPADAVAHVKTIVGHPPEVTSVRLRQISDIVAYRVVLKDNTSYLIDVHAQQEVIITQDMAQQLALEAYPDQAQILSAEKIDRNDLSYPLGPIPAYRIIIDDEQGTHLYVSTQTGEINQTNRYIRSFVIVEMLHSFTAFSITTHNQTRFITYMLWISSFLTIIAAVIGYYLALPHRWQIRWR